MIKLPNHTALKEWSSAIEAIGRGDQVILIRKGGIADPTFGVEAERFYLFPTFFHQPAQESERTAVRITHWCEVVQIWRVKQLSALHSLEPFVVFSREALEERYRFRADQALHVIGIRAWALLSPASIGSSPAYDGCRSWLSLDEEIDTEGSQPALRATDLEAKLKAIAAALQPGERPSWPQ